MSRPGIETLAYIIKSQQPWMPANLVSRKKVKVLTPSECKVVLEVDNMIFNMMFGNNQFTRTSYCTTKPVNAGFFASKINNN